MQIHSKTDIGKVRSSNQDAFFSCELSEGTVFALVCDGMGGANAGNVASETAIKVLSDYVIRSYRPAMDSFECAKMLKNAIQSANMEIYDMSLKNESLKGMGTTVVAAIIKEEMAVIAHVGDSRAYLLDGELTQLTRDHSVVQTLLESGKITAEYARVHPRKNVITRALGAESEVVIDTCEAPFDGNKALLLCTDGLTNFAELTEIEVILKEIEPENVPEKLIELANSRGGSDNITVVSITK